MMARADYWHSNVTHNISTIISELLGKGPCRATKGDVDFKYHPYCENEKLRADYVCPDIMIMCDKSKMLGGAYYGVPKFIVEVLSPSTANKDRKTKMHIYEEAGVSEYWMISPNAVLDIYYLEDGRYAMEHSYILCTDEKDKSYNADAVLTLREFPNVKMTLGNIFEDTWE